MVDFTSILDKPLDSVEKPQPKPTGTYQAAVNGMPEMKTVNTKNGEKAVLAFSVKLISPLKDVDTDRLKAAGDLSDWLPFSKDFWVGTPEGDFALKRFLSEVLQVETAGKSYREALAEAPGRQFAVEVKHRPYTNRDGQPDIASELGNTAAL